MLYHHIVIMDQSTTLDLFKLYFNDMKDLYSAYINMILTISASLLTIIGWFMTSEKPHKIVDSYKYAVVIFLICLWATAIVEAVVILKLMETHRYIQNAITGMAIQLEPRPDALPIESYTYRKIGIPMACVYYGF